jgi:hypothetical protein
MATNTLLTRYLRIHPREPKKGYRVRVYNVYGSPFAEERGWYRVSFREDQFAILRMIRNEPDNPDSKPVFDICTEEERKALEAAEARAKEPRGQHSAAVDLNRSESEARYAEDRARGRNSVDLTTSDLRRPAEPEEDENVRDLAPQVPPPAVNTVDGAAPAKRRGRPPKVKPAPTVE